MNQQRRSAGDASKGAAAARSPADSAGLLRAVEAVWETVSPLLPGFMVEVLPEIDSTNTELMRRARAGQIEPVLLVAEQQTAGRGRLGRFWHSDSASSLTFSLGLPLAPADWAGLSLAVGVTLAETLHPDLRLKWPNDLWLHERKLAGILIETATGLGKEDLGRYAVIGVGINLGEPPERALATSAAWLREVMADAEPGNTLSRIALPLVRALKTFESAGFAAFQAGFDARDALRDRHVILSDGTSGLARGTSASGALMVHTAGAVKTVISSEVSVRPVADSPER